MGTYFLSKWHQNIKDCSHLKKIKCDILIVRWFLMFLPTETVCSSSMCQPEIDQRAHCTDKENPQTQLTGPHRDEICSVRPADKLLHLHLHPPPHSSDPHPARNSCGCVAWFVLDRHEFGLRELQLSWVCFSGRLVISELAERSLPCVVASP